ncbi:spore coat protein [Alicyclobacillus dauci]|uniref:Spore coat protein n=1 Tax=Alicyclobacillus dauci TaxID=1475485 RepID=A0ABY6YYG1_9BACL|nr:spore coat protein [Alicyclobacillus dauci]WAH35663.1 spore coat protein [Alicyclobacillus dauci]
MNPIIENLTGTSAMTDQVIATDLLMATKTGVRNYAIAITEAATPEVRSELHRQLEDSITAHEQVSRYMMDKGWYYAYNIPKQIDLDLKGADNAQETASQMGR